MTATAARTRYPSDAQIERAVDVARRCGIIVGGIEINRDGSIRILPAEARLDSPYEQWKARRQGR